MTVVIAIGSILFLVVLHELGHFLLAKKFGVRVEEFGIGLPPRIVGKRIGETLYSLNLLPLGAFVRMTGEEQRSSDPRSFTKKPILQRILIVAGGVLAFWAIAALIFMGLGATKGIPSAVDDDQVVQNARVQILLVAKGSPSQEAGLVAGDIVTDVEGREVNKVRELQDYTQEFKGQEVTLTISRGSEVKEIALVPRADPPEGEGPLGILLSRTALLKYQWYEAPWQGVVITGRLTVQIVQGLWHTIATLVQGQGLPQGVEFTGPVGIVSLLNNTLALGVSSFLFFLATLSVYLAIFNVLPIPAVDGGRLLFLLLEAFRRKPLSERVEKNMIAVSFGVLIALLLYVTLRDISRLL